jgi:cyclophilin family peptidyl-prolyl cis-trans isomerase
MPEKRKTPKNPPRSSTLYSNPNSYLGPQRAATLVVFISIIAFVQLISKVQNKINPAQPTAVSSLQTPELVGTRQYSSAPPMLIDVTKQYFATVKMAKGGEFVIQLYPDKSPIAVNSFVFLARQGYFDGLTFHRVLEDFMAQTGDPIGTGYGGPGYQFVNEENDLTFDKAGVVAMANSGRDTNGSQFFITFAPKSYLNGDYTIFGQVISGMDVVEKITLRDPDKNPDYSGDIIESIILSEE